MKSYDTTGASTGHTGLVARAVALALVIPALAGCGQIPPSPTTHPGGPSPAPSVSATASASPRPSETRLALISDYGTCDEGEKWAAGVVRSLDVEAIITGGDNSQHSQPSACVPYEDSVWGAYSRGADGLGDPPLWPALGNHDYNDPGAGLDAYQAAFPYLSKDADPQHRWYTQSLGNVRLFVVDSEVVSVAEMEQQRLWLKESLRAQNSSDRLVWNLVVLHRPPYTSGVHQPNRPMRPRPDGRWEYQAWGADLVVSGHQHIYEDVIQGGFHYVTAATSAGTLERQCPSERVPGSRICLPGPGLLKIDATSQSLTLTYLARESATSDGTKVADTITLTR